ncbi:P-loop containing nucleoside triphosphate hydrolase protein [Jaminaea rosea]|uniref:P-loop containing nucleoside triphosphate hydrolase protein n=1 Tax=Jaminaea rosea TaxID=1569628 RepID=A0A316UV47_9BASI|nr:P-loop containing nucleoside triphosphate hydrolase protein [Jaminaea rosea]PWN27793.1 P-loop containing nucleoside triphosphate hydrolase protein [Jaminaea rosea]
MPPTTSDHMVPSEKTTLSPPTNITTPQPPQPVIGRTSRSSSPPPPLDRYARIYVPAWLKAVNADLNYTLVPLQEASAAEEGKIDFYEYARGVWPMWLREKMQQRGVGEAIYAAEAVDDGQELERTADAWLPAGGPGEDDALEEEGHVTSDDLRLGVASTSSDDFDPTKALLSAPVSTRPKGRIYRPDDPDSHLPPALSGIAALRAHSYAEHFNPLLSAESKHREEELADSAVYSQQLHAYTRPRPGAPSTAWDQDGLYRLALPGIREERPRLVAGDRAFLRPLATQLEGEAEHGWLHIVFECRITAVRAVQGEIVLSCPLLSTYLAAYFTNVEAARFNVIFVYDGRLISDATDAVDTTARRLRSRAQWWRKTLFPTLEDAPSTTVFPHDALAWRDATLNREQRAAVSAIAMGGHCLPFLLSGPPGTGKTKTCVEAILQLVSRDPTNRILVVAPSNAASDVLALRLADHLSPGQLLRLNDPTRTFAEVPQRLSLFCYVDESKNIYSLPPWEKLMAAQVVVTATHDAALLLKSRSASNTDVGDLQLSLLPGLLKVEHARPLPHWTHLIVDEAAQGTEPDLTPALAVVAPHPQTQRELWPSVVLVGDPAQLGPQVRNSDARNQGLDVSLLERLSRRAVYSRSLARLKKEGRGIVLGAAPSLTSSAAASHCGHLIRNYRARHPALLHLPSTLFYSDSLVPCSHPTPRSLSALRWSRLAHNSARSLADQLPLLFVDVKGHDEWVDEGVSWWNEDEARIVGECCQSLVGDGVVKAEEIAVITPFREQVWRVRLLLRRMGLGGVSVGPVEALQGQEAPLVIISPVRSRPRFLARDREHAQGIVGESKRLNVSLTRARELCIVVGNAQTLEEGCDEWRELLRHARRNGWYAGEKGESDGEKKDGDTLGQLVSALESAEMGGHGWWRRMLEEGGDTLISNGDRRPPAAVEDGIGLLAGRMATVPLQDDGSDHGGDGSEDGDGRS